MCNHDAGRVVAGMRRARQSVYGEKAMIAVLFDFNGVLVDDEDVHFEAFRRILEVLGVTISHEVYRRYLGFDDRGTIVALLAHYGRGGDVDDGELGRLVARKQRSYALLSGQHPRLGFGARALVLALRAAGARLAIVSGARRAEIDAVLDASSLRDCFDAIVAAEDVTRGKPDPEGYRLARARLDAVAGAPLPAVAIEDAPAGLRAARDAGARCIGLATTCPAAELDGADEIVPSLAALDARALIQSTAGPGAAPTAPAHSAGLRLPAKTAVAYRASGAERLGLSPTPDVARLRCMDLRSVKRILVPTDFSDPSAEALANVVKVVARGDRNVLDWEPVRWVEDILHRMAVEMVKTMAVIATRVVLPPVPRRVPCDVH